MMQEKLFIQIKKSLIKMEKQHIYVCYSSLIKLMVQLLHDISPLFSSAHEGEIALELVEALPKKLTPNNVVKAVFALNLAVQHIELFYKELPTDKLEELKTKYNHENFLLNKAIFITTYSLTNTFPFGAKKSL